jgi:hypothetical protein
LDCTYAKNKGIFPASIRDERAANYRLADQATQRAIVLVKKN